MVSKLASASAPEAVKAPAAKRATPVRPEIAIPVAKKIIPPVKPQVVAKKPVKAVVPKVVAAKSATVKSAPAKVKKPKLVRDSFTMPKDEYVVIESMKVRSGKLGQAVKKSELLRAGIKVLANLSDIQFKAALSDVPALKTGRPKHVK